MGLRTTKRVSGGYYFGRFLPFLRQKDIGGGGSNPPKDVGLQARGGNSIIEYQDGGFFWRAHVYTTSGTFIVDGIPGAFGSDVEYLVVGGGGGASNGYYGDSNCGVPGTTARGGGGGGAAGLRTNSPTMPVSNGTPFTITTTTYPVIIGGGGAAATNGSPSTFNVPGTENTTKFTSQGGGGGGRPTGAPGGSGGGGDAGCWVGGSGDRVTGTSTPAPSQGNPGGTGSPQFSGGSGGSILPTGGITSIFDGTSVVYSLGGSGGYYDFVNAVGGGAYGTPTTQNKPSAQIGSDGVVIVRYKISE